MDRAVADGGFRCVADHVEVDRILAQLQALARAPHLDVREAGDDAVVVDLGRGEDDLAAELLRVRRVVALDDDVPGEQADFRAVLGHLLHKAKLRGARRGVALAPVVVVQRLRQRDGPAAVEDGGDGALLCVKGVVRRRGHKDHVARDPVHRVLEGERRVARDGALRELGVGDFVRAVQVEYAVADANNLRTIHRQLQRVAVALQSDGGLWQERLLGAPDDELASKDEDVRRVERQVPVISRKLQYTTVHNQQEQRRRRLVEDDVLALCDGDGVALSRLILQLAAPRRQRAPIINVVPGQPFCVPGVAVRVRVHRNRSRLGRARVVPRVGQARQSRDVVRVRHDAEPLAVDAFKVAEVLRPVLRHVAPVQSAGHAAERHGHVGPGEAAEPRDIEHESRAAGRRAALARRR
mmetsp:Transcript_14189/g.47384  ORF Transcript_14189/g.47384 Transcript_14189/m.47384 type:complete len:410 (-) Transcript_14189:1284-2513(-)